MDEDRVDSRALKVVSFTVSDIMVSTSNETECPCNINGHVYFHDGVEHMLLEALLGVIGIRDI